MGLPPRQFLFSRSLTASWPTATQVQQWRDLWAALRAQLRVHHIPGDAFPTRQARPAAAQAGPDFTLRECLAALQAMHFALQHETAQRRALERACLDARQALTLAHQDLAWVRKGERQARHQALHDELTALPNRRHLLHQLGQALAQHCPQHAGPTVIYIDLDHFKAVNDTHGHGVGDEVLRITAARLSSAVRHGDLVVRLGGDEFACLLQGIDCLAPLRQLCTKLLEAVSRPMQVGDLQLLVRPSLGVAICPAQGMEAHELLACADTAMYAAKRNRRGFAFYGDVV